MGGGHVLEKSNQARELRKNMTDAERVLWRHLRNRDLGGFKFRRQHHVDKYVVDFACLEKRLVVEVDGGQHADGAGYELKRTLVLESYGFKVLRFWNNEVLGETEAVLGSII